MDRINCAIKVDESDKRIFAGTATTHDLSRGIGYIKCINITEGHNVPLLLDHNDMTVRAIVGRASFYPQNNGSLRFIASIPSIDQDGPLKQELDDIWLRVKSGLIDMVSIGAMGKVTKDESGEFYIVDGNDSLIELSLVAIGANPDAKIDIAASYAKEKEEKERIKQERIKHGAIYL